MSSSSCLKILLTILIGFGILLLPKKQFEFKKANIVEQLPRVDLRAKKEVYGIVTKYNPVPEQTDSTPFITASGKRVREGMIACPAWLPFGTKVEIEGKVYVCEDRMAKRYRYKWHFDILTFDKEEAKKWGAKKLKIKIL